MPDVQMPNELFEFFLIVSDPEIANYVASRGVTRLFVDLETYGKAERQKGLNSVQSVQTPKTLSLIRESAPDAHILCRCNPLHENSTTEVDDIITRGADSIMLPMFRDRDTLARFYDIVDNRLKIVPLFETVGSLGSIFEIVQTLPLERVHFGLNDLHLERKDKFLLQPLVDGVLDQPAKILLKNNIQFGIGGLARLDEGIVPPRLLISEHVRLGSTAAILSRSFHRNSATCHELKQHMNFEAEVSLLLDQYAEFCSYEDDEIQKCKDQIAQIVHSHVETA